MQVDWKEKKRKKLLEIKDFSFLNFNFNIIKILNKFM